MKDWIPLLQTALWPVLVAIILFLNRHHVGRLAKALTARVEQNAPIKTGGLEIGSAPQLPPVPEEEAIHGKSTNCHMIPVEFYYLGWQESPALLAHLVEPDIPDGP